MKKELKDRAISLRKQGQTYSEILKIVNVSKSTLSLWLRNVGLAERQFQKLTLKKIEAGKRGGIAKRNQRIARTNQIFKKAVSDIKSISKRELWLIGISLYWAEGSKEKEYHPGSQMQFGNSDPYMVKVFLSWLREVCKVSKDRIIFEIYIHENSKNNIEKVVKYWSNITGYEVEKFNRIYYKKHKIKTNRRNTGDLYYGGIRVKVRSSSTLVRQVEGWSRAISRTI